MNKFKDKTKQKRSLGVEKKKTLGIKIDALNFQLISAKKAQTESKPIDLGQCLNQIERITSELKELVKNYES